MCVCPSHVCVRVHVHACVRVSITCVGMCVCVHADECVCVRVSVTCVGMCVCDTFIFVLQEDVLHTLLQKCSCKYITFSPPQHSQVSVASEQA